jgi:glycosyltransferase involved in cell wall biosynthesis
LQVHRQSIRQYPERRFFHTHFRELDDITSDVVDLPLWGPIPDEKWQVVRMLGSTFIHGNSICVARSALLEAGGFDARFRNGQDYDMWLRLLARHPAVFIPERTCVTRIHASQGTQTFARAGYYDSARAAINFLNTHALPELFPSVDFQEPAVVEEAIRRALDVAGNPKAFVYALGAHPLLFLRVLEWIDLNADGAWKGRLRELVMRQCGVVVSRSDDGALAFYAKVLAAALRRSGGVFRYDPLAARAIASQQLGALRSAGDSEAAELERYLKRTWDVVEPSVDCAHWKRHREVVFVCQRGQRLPAEVVFGTLHATLEVARYAQRSGYRVLVIASSDCAFGFVEGLPFIGARDEKALARVLRSLRLIYGVVGVSRADVLTIVAAQHSLVYHHGPHGLYGEVPIRALNRAGVPVVCVSEYSRSQLAGFGVAPNLLKVIRNGYDQTAFPGAEAVARVSHSLVMAGTVVDYKGVDVALEALRMIRERFPDATLSVFGSNLAWHAVPAAFESRGLIDEQRRLVWEAIETAFPGVRYRGEVSRRELAVAFAAHGFLVMPSRIGETFGIVSLEAQACGCLPVLPKEGAFAETMLPGETGFLYESNTAAGLADRVIGLWESQPPTKDQRARAQAWVSEEFSWKLAGSEVLSLLDAAPSGAGLRLPLKKKVFVCEMAFGRLARRNRDRARHVFAAVEGQPIADWPRLVRGLWDARRSREA